MSKQRREKLKIVFRIGVQVSKPERVAEVIAGTYQQNHGITDVEALASIVDTLKNHGFRMDIKENGEGSVISAEDYLEKTVVRGRWNRPVETDELRFSFNFVPKFNICVISIEEIQEGVVANWDVWLKPFILRNDFVQAWVSDVEYDYWQNICDPLQYEVAGREYDHLPKKSNGLPPPLEQIEIDTSNNPGRWVFRKNYIEAIGSPMWLSKEFWGRIDEDGKRELKNFSGLSIVIVFDSVVRLSVASGSFFDDSTEVIQRRLRSVLYRAQ